MQLKALDIIESLFDRRLQVGEFLNFNRDKAIKSQEKTLIRMLFKAQETEFGKKYNFKEIAIHKHPYTLFSKTVPLSNYSSMHPWWQRSYAGEANVCWPGITKHFALSSGTSEGASKYIPVSKDQIKAIMRASRRQLFAVFKTDVPKDFFTKNYLVVGGSTDLQFDGTSYSGDLSGITTGNMPSWFDRFSTPPPEIRALKVWQEKIEAIVKEAPNWDVAMIAGVPAWIKLLMEKIIETYNKKNIHEIWPNLSVYLWGGVSITPYKASIDACLGQPIKYFETYLASEGFVAFQAKPDSKGMRLVFKNSTYYEFVPFNEANFYENGEMKPNPTVLTLAQVEEGIDYAILLSTAAGAWRYAIGDTIKFVDLETCEIKITGRTKHYISICGEHLSVDNMNEALRLTGLEMGTTFGEYTVKGLKMENTFGHQWYISCADKNITSEKVLPILDKYLGEVNDDYIVERKHALKEMYVKMLPETTFINWMAANGKLGGQHKFPRVLNDAQYTSWLDFLEQHGN